MRNVLFLALQMSLAGSSQVVVVDGNSSFETREQLQHEQSGSPDLGKDIVSNVVKAIQITTEENLFLANIFNVASKISNLSLEATNAAVHLQALKAYVDLLKKCLELIDTHRSKNLDFEKLIERALSEANSIMTTSPVQPS
jgi:ATP-dependent RNA circularization protein (DNA/RNA ligase family)